MSRQQRSLAAFKIIAQTRVLARVALGKSKNVNAGHLAVKNQQKKRIFDPGRRRAIKFILCLAIRRKCQLTAAPTVGARKKLLWTLVSIGLFCAQTETAYWDGVDPQLRGNTQNRQMDVWSGFGTLSRQSWTFTSDTLQKSNNFKVFSNT